MCWCEDTLPQPQHRNIRLISMRCGYFDPQQCCTALHSGMPLTYWLHGLVAVLHSEGGVGSVVPEDYECPELRGGLNGSTQHFILNGGMEVLRWFEGFVEALRRQRERRCGIVGSGGNR